MLVRVPGGNSNSNSQLIESWSKLCQTPTQKETEAL